MRGRRPEMRPLEAALTPLRARLSPAALIDAVVEVWPAAVGEMVAAQARPVAERQGVVTVACRSAVWAHELDLRGPELVGRVNALLDVAPGARSVERLRCVVRPG